MHTFLNQIIAEKGYKSYLEIGVDDPKNTFNHIRVDRKTGVDPYEDSTQCHAWNETNRKALINQIVPTATFYQPTSDDFLNILMKEKPKFLSTSST